MLAENNGNTSLHEAFREHETIINELKKEMDDHYHANSRTSPSEFLSIESKNRGYVVNKRCMTCSYRRAYHTFPREEQVPGVTFYKCRGRKHCPLQRQSDKCSYCMEYYFLNAHLHKFREKMNRKDNDQNVVIVPHDDNKKMRIFL